MLLLHGAAQENLFIIVGTVITEELQRIAYKSILTSSDKERCEIMMQSTFSFFYGFQFIL